jgi:hypothetical protein
MATLVDTKLLLCLCLTTLSMSCGPYYCGSGEFKCKNIVYPIGSYRPLKADDANAVVLLENGLLQINRRSGDSVLSLKEVCGSDSIVDIVFYNQSIALHNYSTYDESHYPPESSFCEYILSPSAVYKLDSTFNLLFSFGSDNSSNENLQKAVSLDVDFSGNLYIADAVDSTVKVYDGTGLFVAQWPIMGLPEFLKIYDGSIYILSQNEGKIKKFNLNGVFLNYYNSLPLRGVTAFGFADKDVYWIADEGGTRLTRYKAPSIVLEMKDDYCFKGTNYGFQKITGISAFPSQSTITDNISRRLIYLSTLTHLP